MLQTHANRMNNTYRLFDLQGTTMLTAKNNYAYRQRSGMAY